MIWSLAKEEIKFQIHRPIFWMSFFSLGLVAFVDLNNVGYSQSFLTKIGTLNHDSWLVLSRTFTVAIIFSLLVQPIISGFSALKDYDYGLHLFYLSLPISKKSLFLGKVIGLIGVNLILYSALLFGSLFGVETLPENFHSDDHFIPYFCAFGFVAPFFFLLSLLIFSVGLITRSQTTTFLTGIVIIAVLSILNSLLSSRALLDLPMMQLLDISGLNFLDLEILEMGKSIEGDPKPLSAWKILERIAILIFLFLGIYFYTSHVFEKNPLRFTGSMANGQEDVNPTGERVEATTYFSTRTMSHGIQLKVLFFFYFFRIIKNPAFIITTCLIVSQVFSNFYKNVANFNLKPTSAYFLNFGLDGVKEPLYLLSLFLTGIIIWNERSKKVDQVLLSYPIPNRIWVISKFTAVCSSLFLILILLILFGISIQLYFEYYNINLLAYLNVIIGQDLLSIVACTAVFFLIHYLSPNLYVGLGISLALFVLSVVISGTNNYFYFNYFSYIPRPLFSETNGFGPLAGSIRLFQICWMFCSFLFLVLCLQLVKNRDSYLIFIKTSLYRFKNLRVLIPLLLILGVLILPVFRIYTEGKKTSQFLPEKLLIARVQYEKAYSDYLSVPTPQIINTELNVQLYPEKDSVGVKGIYLLKNTTDEPIDSILINAYMASKVVGNIEIFHRENIKSKNRDFKAGVIIIHFNKPLLVGQNMSLEFSSFYKNDFPNIYNPNRFIYKEGAYLANYLPFFYNLFPTIGYDKSREIRDHQLREEYGLKKNKGFFSEATDSLPQDRATNSWTQFSAVISFPKGYDVITNGRLLKSIEKNNRRIAKYQTSEEISNEFSIVLGKYKKSSIISKNYTIEFFTKGLVDENEKSIKAAVVNSLDQFDETFGKIRTRNLRIVQIPAYNLIPGTAISKPEIILWDENGGLYFDDREKFDKVYSTAAHEMSHQWWAHSVKPATYYEGGLVLNESLAQLSRLLVLSSTVSSEEFVTFLNGELWNYNYKRQSTLDEEEPLYRASQDFVAYEKASLVMNSFLGYLGRDKIKSITEEYFKKFKYKNDSFPTTKSFYNILRRKTPDSLQYLIQDSFFKVVTYEMKIEKYDNTKNGIEVIIDIKKYNHQEEINFFNEIFQVGIVKDNLSITKWLKLHSGINKILIPEKVDSVILDPNFLLIDFTPENNVLNLKDPVLKN